MSQDISIDESQNPSVDEERSEDDIINILVATDIHMGFAEKDPIRSQDTFVTFEEILSIAQQRKVDFILLGGDLFHDSRPSTYCLYKCTDLLKKYCLGDRPVQIEYLSDPSHNFCYTGNDTVNYEDPNLNVGMPVFSIHGNHDDPTGEHQISALNLLSSTGLVNYFGKYTNYDEVKVEPILLKKGVTKLALYGLSHIKDERLARLFLDHKVTFMSPPGDDWFHLLVLHQNRANRGAKTFIPDQSLPDFLNMVIWGHEHDCRITPEMTSNNVFISQPGSSVATSLCQGESILKQVGLLQIHKDKFNLSPIRLRTVRPLIFDDLMLTKVDGHEFQDEELTDQAIAERLVERKVEDMILQAKNLGQIDMLPLIRLNVTYIDEHQVFNAIRFGNKFMGKVANPKDMVKMKVKKKVSAKGEEGENDDPFANNPNLMPANRVEDLVLQIFESDAQKKLKSLSLKSLNDAVMKGVDCNNTNAPICVANHLMKELLRKLEHEMVGIDDVDEFCFNVKDQDDDEALVDQILNKSSKAPPLYDDMAIDSGSDDEDSPAKGKASPKKPARGRGSRGGPGSRGGRGSRARGRAAAK